MMPNLLGIIFDFTILNINVMDENGVIIGSGDVNRIVCMRI